VHRRVSLGHDQTVAALKRSDEQPAVEMS